MVERFIRVPIRADPRIKLCSILEHIFNYRTLALRLSYRCSPVIIRSASRAQEGNNTRRHSILGLDLPSILYLLSSQAHYIDDNPRILRITLIIDRRVAI